jgi:RND family efflux transporter MFP subunit
MADRHIRVSPAAAVAALLIVLLAGAGGAWLMMRDGRDGAGAPTGTPPTSATRPVQPEAAGDVVVTLANDAVERAGIVITTASTTGEASRLRLPGIVEPNAYRQVSVTALVGGRVVSVSAQLGDRVSRGQRLAQVYSPELAEARARYVAAKAMLEAHDRELQRTERLVEIGAASRQELERIHAEHAAQTAGVDSARSRLALLGVAPDEAPSSSQATADTNVTAPIDGVVTERFANTGLNIDPATKLFTIVDLSDVWIVADVYERDLPRIRQGARALVATAALPDRSFEGTVSFVDPQLNSATRTARIRVEIANPRGELRPGMYADVAIDSASGAPVVTVPREAIQEVASREVVYVASPSTDATTFTEREVRLGQTLGDRVEILSGVAAGDAIVSTGSFSVRAEVERLGLRGAPSFAPTESPSMGDGR